MVWIIVEKIKEDELKWSTILRHALDITCFFYSSCYYIRFSFFFQKKVLEYISDTFDVLNSYHYAHNLSIRFILVEGFNSVN